MKWQEKLSSSLSALPAGAHVGVVTLLGSLCPITNGHLLAFVEARRLLLGGVLGGVGVGRPSRLETFDDVVGLISLNGDSYVDRKLKERGTNSLDIQQRRMLVDMSIADMAWMASEDREGGCIEEMRLAWPHLTFTHFLMNGADDVRKHRKWTWGERMIAMGRPGDTEFVVEAARRDGVDLEAGTFVIGPELPEISSTAARTALSRGEATRAAEMLPPAVLMWCLEHGPWRGRRVKEPDTPRKERKSRLASRSS